MKKYFLEIVFVLSLLPFCLSAQKKAKVKFPYQNSALATEERVKDLLSRMTLEEKVAQTQCIWSQAKKKIMNEKGAFDEAKALKNFSKGLGQVARPNETFGSDYISKSLNARQTAELSNTIQRFFIEKTRLGIPVTFHEESLHGNQAKDATNFPSHLALGATWNEALLTEIYTAVAEEVRVRGAQHVLAPVVDLGRDPRWGRTEETLGEDPYHVSRMAVAEIKAYQGNSRDKIDKKHVITTLKHFGVHGMPEGGSNIGPSFVDERTLREVYFPSFKACVQEAGALSIMPCYNELSGTPAHGNVWMLQNVLRKEWGFKGLVVSDYMGIQEMKTIHRVAPDTIDAAFMAIKAGVDVETPYDYAYSKLVDLVKKGTISESLLDETVGRILTSKFNTGLFDDPYTDPVLAEQIVGSAKNRALALKAAHESMVLLKNQDGLLPLNLSKYAKIAIVGPNADRCVLGGYSDSPKQVVTPLQGIKNKIGNRAQILYSEGCKLTVKGDWFSEKVEGETPENNAKRIEEAVKVAQQSDIVLLFVGGNEAISREAWSKGHMGDITNLELMFQQNDLIKALKATGKPLIAFVTSGPPLAISYLNEQANSIVQCWYLGQETGTAIADLLMGDVVPSGKLSVSMPRSAGHLPVYYNYKPSARRGYAFDQITPLYPFGHGLSYTKFEYSDLKLSNTKIQNGAFVNAQVTLKNTGTFTGTEVVQLYLRDEYSSVSRPVKELKDFKRVTLKPGETQVINFTITPDKLKFYNLDMKEVVEPGTFEVFVGTSSVENLSTKFEVLP